MSLDVYLNEAEKTKHRCVCNHCENEHFNEYEDLLFHRNITHNLGNLADHLGVYECLWRPEEIDIKTAYQLIPILESCLEKIKNKQESDYVEFLPKNGWGTLKSFLTFINEYLDACRKFPNSIISVSR